MAKLKQNTAVLKAVQVVERTGDAFHQALCKLNEIVPKFEDLGKDERGQSEGRAILRLGVVMDDMVDGVTKRGKVAVELKNAGVL